MSTPSHSPALWGLGVAAIALSGFSLWTVLDRNGNNEPKNVVQDEQDPLVADSLEKISEGQKLLLASIEALRLRVNSLEESGQRTQVQLSESVGEKTGSSALPATGPGAGANKKPAMNKKEFAALLQEMFRQGGKATEDQQELFWKLARTTTMLDDHIKELRAAVLATPDSAERRLELADAYVAKLLTVPDGPERGGYAARAESQWKNILKKDPSHWESQVSLGFSHSQYPDFLNMTGEAIQDFEKALKIQERLPQKTAYSVTYSQLALLYRKQGKIDKALTTLREGNRRFPKDAAIRKLLDELQQR